MPITSFNRLRVQKSCNSAFFSTKPHFCSIFNFLETAVNRCCVFFEFFLLE